MNLLYTESSLRFRNKLWIIYNSFSSAPMFAFV